MEPEQNLHHPEIKDEELGGFESPLKDIPMKIENEQIKSENSNLAELGHPLSHSEVRATKRVKIEENAEESKELNNEKAARDLSQEKKKELNRKSASQCRK